MSPETEIARSSSSRFRSTSTSGDAARAFITFTSVWPPASARAPSWPASSRIASSTDPGRAYSTSRRSMTLILRRFLPDMSSNQGHVEAVRSAQWRASMRSSSAAGSTRSRVRRSSRKSGWKVCVLERNEWLGGAIRTVEGLIAPGFTHEVFASWHPLWTGSPAYAELKPDLDRLGVEYLNTELATGSAFPDGSSVFLSTDGAANAAELGDAWPRQFDEFMAERGSRLRRPRHGALVGRRARPRPAGVLALRSPRAARVRRPGADDRARLADGDVRRRGGSRAPRAVGAAHRARPGSGDLRLHDAGDRLRAPARRDARSARRRGEARGRPGDDRPRGRR